MEKDNDLIKGKMFVREVPGYKVLVAVVKSESVDLKGEHQYVITGSDNGSFVDLRLWKDCPLDVSETSKAQSIGGVLCSRIWQT